MKTIYLFACIGILNLASYAQTISPGVPDYHSMVYDFREIVLYDSAKVEFTIAGLSDGTPYETSIVEPWTGQNGGPGCDNVTFHDPDFTIVKGKTGTVSGGVGKFTVRLEVTPIISYSMSYDDDGNGDCVQGVGYPSPYRMTADLFLSVNNGSDMYTIKLFASLVEEYTVTDVKEEKVFSSFSPLVFPNPTENLTYLSEVASIYDAQGTLQMENVKGTIDLTALPKGVYLVKSSYRSQKLVKK